jgi:tyrosyl-tRNA synthetase
MKNVFNTLTERGFIKQTVYEEDLINMLGSESVAFYIGFDPTADSLHVGHFLQLMAMSHMQKAGHKPIVLIGGGTAMIGDPSGRSDLRQMMTVETIRNNCEAFKRQMSKFFSFEGKNAAVMVNNADWLLDLNYVDFLRDIGVYFSVNRMLTADCYKSRLEKGLTFLEFNYMLMQSYDFLELFRKFGCRLQCGGDDQWSNILAGADLIRRKEQEPAYAMTFALLTTSEGKKMGKTASGAVWLDPAKTSPYDFYQYWRNVDDADVERCMKLLTFMEVSEIAELTKHTDERINIAKMRLAFEVTKIVHGEAAAIDAEQQAKAAFSGDTENMPEATIPVGMTALTDILVAIGAAPSKSEAKRLIQSNSVSINDEKQNSIDCTLTDDVLSCGFKLSKGKKLHLKVVVK